MELGMMNLATIVAMMLTLAALADGTEMQEDKSANVPEQQADPGLGKALLRKAIERVAHRQKGYYAKEVTERTTEGDITYLCVTEKRGIPSCDRDKNTRFFLKYKFSKILTSDDFFIFLNPQFDEETGYMENYCCTRKPTE